MTNELVAWLRAQVDEDERVAMAVKEGTRQWQLREDVPSERDGVTYTLVGLDDDVFAGWDGALTLAEAAHIARHDPARVLAEVAAKRRIIDALELAQRNASEVRRTAPDYQWIREADAAREALLHAVRLLASVYAGRPGWRQKWATDEEVQRG